MSDAQIAFMHRGSSRRGGVLVLVLVVTMVISTLALVVAGRVRSRVGELDVQRRLLRARRGAISAANAALAIVWEDTNGWDAVGERWSGVSPQGSSVADMQVRVFAPGGDESSDNLVALRDEASLICINSASESLLRLLFSEVGGLRGDELSVAVDSLMDWIDADDEPREDGAEAEAYGAMQDSYLCANAPLSTLEELLLVRGITVEAYQRLAPLLTVHGDGLLNLNTVSPVVLRLLARAEGGDPDAAMDAAQALLDARESGSVYKDASSGAIHGVLREYGTPAPAESAQLRILAPFFCVKTDCFRGIAVADSGGAYAALRRIEFVISRSSGTFIEWFEH